MKRTMIVAKRYWVLILFCSLLLLPSPYFALWCYFLQAVPNAKFNYLDSINELDSQFGIEQRAWPIYRESVRFRRVELERFVREQATLKTVTEYRALKDSDGEKWTEIGLELGKFGDLLAAMHRARSRPVLGLDLHPTYLEYPEEAVQFTQDQEARLSIAVWQIDLFAWFVPAKHVYDNYDLVQRFYTDNGSGDGHLTNDWLLLLQLTDGMNLGGTKLLPPPESMFDAIRHWAYRPFVVFAKPTRAQVMETLKQHEELLRQAWSPPYDRDKIQDVCDQIKTAKLPTGMINDYNYLVTVFDRLVLLEAKRQAILEALSSPQPEFTHEINR